MGKINTNYSNFITTILKICIILYTIYMLLIILQNIILKETYGELTSIHNYQEHIIRAPNKFEGDRARNGYVEEYVWRKDIYYKYTVDGINYSNSRISNVLIFPNTEYFTGDKITVYFNKFYPKYSILYKCNIGYFVINTIPILILFLIKRHIEKRKN